MDTLELAGLSVVDYIILVMVLVVSLGIGVYHGVRGNRTTEEFLLANRSLSPLPVACSLIVSFLSSVSVMGFTSEVYGYGLEMYWMVTGIICALLLTIHVTIPVFYELQLKSINEYITLRFKSPGLKYLMLIVTCIKELLLLGIILYAPTLAMASVTPISSDTYILITGIVVTLYSSLGGMKAVVWTDVFQTVVLLLGVMVISFSSMVKAGGLVNAFQIAKESGRLGSFSMSVGLHERHTIINTFIMGLSNYFSGLAFNQAAVQRCITQRSKRNAKGIMYANLVVTVLMLTILFMGGIGMYAVYHGCDPISLGVIKKRDQILPLYVMQHLHFLTGVPGLFIACLFSGTLSSVSSTLNAVPAMLWNDFLAELEYFQTTTERTKTIFNKLLTTGLGLTMIGLAFLASRTQGMVQTGLTISAIVTGPIAGVFLMGIAIPAVGKRGATTGFLTSLAFVSWIVGGAQFHSKATPMLPLHTHLCENSSAVLPADVVTESAVETPSAPEEEDPLKPLYTISYTYYCLIGILSCIAAGSIVTLATGCESLTDVKPEHVMHCVRRKVGQAEAHLSTELESFLDNAPTSNAITLTSQARRSNRRDVNGPQT